MLCTLAQGNYSCITKCCVLFRGSYRDHIMYCWSCLLYRLAMVCRKTKTLHAQTCCTNGREVRSRQQSSRLHLPQAPWASSLQEAAVYPWAQWCSLRSKPQGIGQTTLKIMEDFESITTCYAMMVLALYRTFKKKNVPIDEVHIILMHLLVSRWGWKRRVQCSLPPSLWKVIKLATSMNIANVKASLIFIVNLLCKLANCAPKLVASLFPSKSYRKQAGKIDSQAGIMLLSFWQSECKDTNSYIHVWVHMYTHLCITHVCIHSCTNVRTSKNKYGLFRMMHIRSMQSLCHLLYLAAYFFLSVCSLSFACLRWVYA